MTESIGSERVVIHIEDGVADVRLNRADKRNALDRAMLEEIDQAGRILAADPTLRAVVLSGEGQAFCAGLDIAAFSDGALDLMPRTHGPANLFQHAAILWRDLAVPVIAALHGACLGGGLQIALGADIRIAAPDTRLSIMEMRWGLVPDMGGFALARGLVREDIWRELTYTAREFSAEEGRETGFVTRLAEDPLKAALTLAREIAGNSPDAVRGAKALFARVSDNRADILLTESHIQTEVLKRPNQRAAVVSRIQGRAPKFAD